MTFDGEKCVSRSFNETDLIGRVFGQTSGFLALQPPFDVLFVWELDASGRRTATNKSCKEHN